MTTLNLVLLLLMLLAGLWTVMVPSLLQSAIGLAVTSAILTLLMFQFDSPLAGVFELSVCAGLITVVFISAISLTKPLGKSEESARARGRLRRFAALPVILAAAGWLLWLVPTHPELQSRLPAAETNVQQVLWSMRRFDLVGQIVVILAGVFGVVVLFRELGKKTEKE